MRGHDDGLVIEEGGLRGRLGREDVKASAGDAALGDRASQGSLVDDAAAGCVDDAHRWA